MSNEDLIFGLALIGAVLIGFIVNRITQAVEKVKTLANIYECSDCGQEFYSETARDIHEDVCQDVEDD